MADKNNDIICDALKNSRNIHEWFNYEKLSVYMRITERYIDGTIIPTIEIANIEVYEVFRHRGVFTEFLNYIEHLAKTFHRCVFVENILNNYIMKMMKDRNYLEWPTDDSCRYKKF